jgi:hypothetical protein
VVVPDDDPPLLVVLLEEAEMALRRATNDGDDQRVRCDRRLTTFVVGWRSSARTARRAPCVSCRSALFDSSICGLVAEE